MRFQYEVVKIENDYECDCDGDGKFAIKVTATGRQELEDADDGLEDQEVCFGGLPPEVAQQIRIGDLVTVIMGGDKEPTGERIVNDEVSHSTK